MLKLDDTAVVIIDIQGKACKNRASKQRVIR